MDPKVELNYLFIARTQGLLKLKESSKKDLKFLINFQKRGGGHSGTFVFDLVHHLNANYC